MSWAVRQPLKVVSPFPNVFCPEVTKSGLISARERPVDQGIMKQIFVIIKQPFLVYFVLL